MTDTRRFPSNLKATLDDKIKQLENAISILKDHIQQFGPQIKQENPTTHLIITKNIQILERELELRLFTKNLNQFRKELTKESIIK